MPATEPLPVQPRIEESPQVSPSSSATVDVYAASRPGPGHAENEDQFLVAELYRGASVDRSTLASDQLRRSSVTQQALLLAIADGMGGHADGRWASQIAIQEMSRYTFHHLPWHVGPEEMTQLARHARALAARIETRLASGRAQQGAFARPPGTTLTAAYVVWPALHLFHVGDSRCYLYHLGELSQLTRDHTLTGAVAAETLRQDPEPAGLMRHVLINALGAGGEPARPDVAQLVVRPGDALVLCSDGVSDCASAEEIRRILEEETSATDCCARLLDTVEREGGIDDASCVVARF